MGGYSEFSMDYPQPHLNGSIQIAAYIPFRIDNRTGLAARHQIGTVGYSGDGKLLNYHNSLFR